MIAQIIINSIITGSIYSLIAFGFTLIYGAMNHFNMAYGVTVMVGAYIFYVFYTMLGIPIIISGVLTAVVTSALMVGIDRLCYYSFRQKRVPRWTAVVVSMSVATLLQAAFTMLFGSRTRTVYKGIPSVFTLGSVRITSIQAATFVFAVVLMVLASIYLKKTRTGKLIRAISNNKEMAMTVGINVELAYIAVIVVGSSLASFAGVFMALDSDVRPMIANTALLKAITASIVGGVGNIQGALLASFLFGFIENFSVLYIGGGWRDALPIVIIVIMMLIRPAAFGISEKS